MADSRNHRLQIFDKRQRYVGMVKLNGAVKRPSGIVYEADGMEPALYVLNLWSDSLCKFIINA